MESSRESIVPSPKRNDQAKVHFRVCTFLIESAHKLRMSSVPQATAAYVYHRYFQEFPLSSSADIDPYIIATTCLYLAGKIEEEHNKIRDVINVCHRTLHKDKPPLEIGPQYFTLRDSVVQCELFLMRVLKFKVNFNHPHKYLLHFTKSLLDWLDPTVARNVPITRTAWSLLQDSYHGTICLRYRPEDIAVSILYFTLECHGVEVPYSHDAESPWWEALVDDISLPRIQKIIVELTELYQMENTIS